MPAPAFADLPPLAGPLPSFPVLAGQGWTTVWRPTFATDVAAHVSGRETRAGREAAALWAAELTFDALAPADLATLAGFYAARRGDALPFAVPVPAELDLGATPALPFRGGPGGCRSFRRDARRSAGADAEIGEGLRSST